MISASDAGGVNPAPTGLFRRPGGGLVGVLPPGDPFTGISYRDYESGRFGMLFPQDDGSFVAGPGARVVEPAEARIEVVRAADGAVIELVWRAVGGGASMERLARVPVRDEEVLVENGDVRLAGTLYLPLEATGGERYPAAVFVHGSGPWTRETPWGWGPLLAAHGIAYLTYDKRGCGESTSPEPWHRASLAELASDAGAAVRSLRGRSDIDSARVGLIGHSQGGWIAPLTAVSEDVAFLVLTGAGATTPEQSEVSRVEHELRWEGVPEDEVAQAVELRRVGLAYARTGQRAAELQVLIDAAKEKPWFESVNTTRVWPDTSWYRRFPFDHHAEGVLERVGCPVLALYGELDQTVKPSENAPLLAAALRRGGNRDVTVRVMLGGSHRLWEQPHGVPVSFVRRFVLGFYQTAMDWLVERFVAS